MTPAGENIMVILSSPSGAGKTTLTKKLQQKYNNFKISVSHTTRPPRSNEVNGVDYNFITKKKFEDLINDKEFYEYAKIFDNYYGTLKKNVDKILKKNDIIFDIDWQGGQQIRNSVLGKHALSLFILPPSIAELERRLNSRAKDNQDVIKNRMALARDEISHWPEYDYVLINNDLDKTENDLKTIIKAERLKLSQQPRIVDDVRNLNNEFENR